MMEACTLSYTRLYFYYRLTVYNIFIFTLFPINICYRYGVYWSNIQLKVHEIKLIEILSTYIYTRLLVAGIPTVQSLGI